MMISNTTDNTVSHKRQQIGKLGYFDPKMVQISPKYHNSSKNESKVHVNLCKPYIIWILRVIRTF